MAGWPRRDETSHSSSSTSAAYVRGAAPVAVDIRDDHNNSTTSFLPRVDRGRTGDGEAVRILPHEAGQAMDDDDDYEEIYKQYEDSFQSTPTKAIHHVELKRPTPSTAAAKLGSGALNRLKPSPNKGAPSISRRTLPLASTATHGLARYMPHTWPTRLFLLVTFTEAAADISIEAVLLSRYKAQQGLELSALPVFVMVFALAHVYQCFLAFDTVINRNLILVLGLNVFNLAL